MGKEKDGKDTEAIGGIVSDDAAATAQQGNTPPPPPVPPPPPAKEEKSGGGSGISGLDIFTQEQEEVEENKLANALPEIDIHDLLRECQELAAELAAGIEEET